MVLWRGARVSAMAVLRPGWRGLRLAGALDRELDASDAQSIAGGERRGRLHPAIVDEGAVGAVEVLDGQVTLGVGAQPAVDARDHRGVEDEVRQVGAADGACGAGRQPDDERRIDGGVLGGQDPHAVVHLAGAASAFTRSLTTCPSRVTRVSRQTSSFMSMVI